MEFQILIEDDNIERLYSILNDLLYDELYRHITRSQLKHGFSYNKEKNRLYLYVNDEQAALIFKLRYV